jgi:hypothetical protein
LRFEKPQTARINRKEKNHHKRTIAKNCYRSNQNSIPLKKGTIRAIKKPFPGLRLVNLEPAGRLSEPKSELQPSKIKDINYRWSYYQSTIFCLNFLGVVYLTAQTN